MEPTFPEVGVSWMSSRAREDAEGSGDGTDSEVGCGAGASPEPSVRSGRSAWGGVSGEAWSWAGDGGWSGVSEAEDAEGVREVWAARSWSCPSECVWDSGRGSGEPGIESVFGSGGMTSGDGASSEVTVCSLLCMFSTGGCSSDAALSVSSPTSYDVGVCNDSSATLCCVESCSWARSRLRLWASGSGSPADWVGLDSLCSELYT